MGKQIKLWKLFPPISLTTALAGLILLATPAFIPSLEALFLLLTAPIQAGVEF